MIFATVIDLARLVLAYSPRAREDESIVCPMFDSLVRVAELATPFPTPLSKHRETNTLLLLRAFANALQENIVVGKWVTTVSF